MSQPPEPTVPGAHFRYLWWVALALGILALLVVFVGQFIASFQTLSQEGGIIETVSYVFWFVAMLCSAGTIYRWRSRDDRLMALCLGTIALLACLRELDLHHHIRPDYLGSYGVHFRIAWWLDGNVSLALKAGWLVIFALLLAALSYPPWKVRPPVLSMARRGNAMIGILILAFFFAGLGGFIDDRLRGTTFVPRELRRLIEETSEMVGAIAFAVSAWLRWRFPLAAHLRSVGLPVRGETA